MIHKYNPDEANRLKAAGELPIDGNYWLARISLKNPRFQPFSLCFIAVINEVDFEMEPEDLDDSDEEDDNKVQEELNIDDIWRVHIESIQ